MMIARCMMCEWTRTIDEARDVEDLFHQSYVHTMFVGGFKRIQRPVFHDMKIVSEGR